MKDKRRSSGAAAGFGTGYVSIIMVFVMICMTILAALSYSAANSNSAMAEKGMNSASDYYAAECSANRILMRLDDAAAKAASSGTFTKFEESAKEINGVSVSAVSDGYKASWNIPVTQKTGLFCEAIVYSEPSSHGGKRYEITEWKTVLSESADSGK